MAYTADNADAADTGGSARNGSNASNVSSTSNAPADVHRAAEDAGAVAHTVGADVSHIVSQTAARTADSVQQWLTRQSSTAGNSAASGAGNAGYSASTAAGTSDGQAGGTHDAYRPGMMTAFDYVVIAIVVLSALRGAWRGLIGEVFALIGWVVALILAARYGYQVAAHVPANWPGGELTQQVIGFVAVAAAVLVISGVGSALLARLTEAGGLRSVDRSLGLLFGVVRGILLVVLLFVVAMFTDLPSMSFWRDALLRPYVAQAAARALPYLPDQVSAAVLQNEQGQPNPQNRQGQQTRQRQTRVRSDPDAQ